MSREQVDALACATAALAAWKAKPDAPETAAALELAHAATAGGVRVVWACDDCGEEGGFIGPQAIHETCRHPDGPGGARWMAQPDAKRRREAMRHAR